MVEVKTLKTDELWNEHNKEIKRQSKKIEYGLKLKVSFILGYMLGIIVGSSIVIILI